MSEREQKDALALEIAKWGADIEITLSPRDIKKLAGSCLKTRHCLKCMKQKDT